jgi:hypothetical protein
VHLLVGQVHGDDGGQGPDEQDGRLGDAGLADADDSQFMALFVSDC